MRLLPAEWVPLRTWRRVSPTIVFTLAIGIAANVAVFDVAYELLYAPPEFVRDPKALFTIRAYAPDRADSRLSWSVYEELQAAPARNLALSAFLRLWGGVRTRTESTRVSIVYADTQYFDLLGVAPVRGRTFSAGRSPSSGIECVVSDGLVDRLGSDAVDVGRPLAVNGIWTTIIGVMPRRFKGLDAAPVDVWISFRDTEAVLRDRQVFGMRTDPEMRLLTLIGRLKAGSGPAAAESEIAARLGQRYRVVLERKERLAAGDRRGMAAISAVMQCAVGLLVVIAVVNAAGLTFARNLARHRELAIRAALGCSRRHLVLVLVAEGMMHAVPALLLAVPLSAVLLYVFVWHLAPEPLRPALADVRTFSLPALLVAGFFATGTSLLTALIPALRITGEASADTLNRLTESIAGAQAGSRRSFVFLQTALAVTLIATVGLLLQTEATIRSTPSGLRTEGVHFARVEPRLLGYDVSRTATFISQIPEVLARAPDLRDVAIARQAPMQSFGAASGLSREAGGADAATFETIGYNVVSANYFGLMGVGRVAGRVFAATDTEQADPVAIVNESLARAWWPPNQAVGARVRLRNEAVPRTIVGVVKDTKFAGLMQEAMPYFYLPITQAHPLMELELTLITRPRGTARAAEAAMKAAVARLDPDLSVFGFSSMAQQIEREAALPTLLSGFVSVAGLVALVLVCLGLNAALSQAFSYMRREAAIRLALGAQPSRLQTALALRVLASMGAGVIAGLAGAELAATGLGRILVEPTLADPTLVGLVVGGIGACAALGTARHLWKLGRLQPSELLRES